jgi:hypothetical protein
MLQPRAPTSGTAENTTTLIDVQHQAAATAASVKDARTYMATVVKNTDWEANGKKIAAILNGALQNDQAALHAAAEAAHDMRIMSVGMSHKVGEAAEAQKNASLAFHSAAERLLRVMEAHQEGKWRRMGTMALVAALCGAVGFFAREPLNKYTVLREAGEAIKQDVTDPDCNKGLRGEALRLGERVACVIWQDAAQ